MSTTSRLVRAACAFAVGTAILSCGGGDAGTGPHPDPGPSTSSSVDVGDNFFSPRATTVPVGTTVTWSWKGSNTHDVTFTSGPAGPSSTIKSSGTFARQFTEAGTYDYFCGVHGPAMSGQVVVR